MKRILLILSLLLVVFNSNAGIIETKIQNTNAVVYLPDDYNPSIQYPLIYFSHGQGEIGTDINKLYIHGPFKRVSGNFVWPQTDATWTKIVDGVSRKCIVIAHQVTFAYNNASVESVKPTLVNNTLNEIISRWSIDEGKICLTGYSAGSWKTMGYVSFQQSYANRIHAIAVVAAQRPGSGGSTTEYHHRCSNIINANIRWFGTCGSNDVQYGFYQYNLAVFDTLNTAGITCAFRTIPGAGHGGQFVQDFFNPNFSNPALGGVDIYTWMLQENGVGNVNPIVNAGDDQSITLPDNDVALNGSATDPDGTISSYLWTKVSGPSSSNIITPTSTSTTVTDLVSGVYVFRLTATDNSGGTGSDDVTITVNTQPGNQPPTVDPGGDQTVTLPTNEVILSGSATDADGTITSYLWEKISGGAATITDPTLASTSVTGLVQGTYVFRFTATDNNEASSNGTVTVNVLGLPGANRTINISIDGVNGYIDDPDWNSFFITGNVTTPVTSPAFTYSDGTQSTITLTISRQIVTADNTVSYTGFTNLPDRALRYVSNHNSTRTLILSGLDNAKYYNLSFVASRNANGYTTVFTINGVPVTIPASHNKSDYATFTNIAPTNGQIIITVSNGTGSTYNHFNALTITEINNEGGNQVPVANAGNDQIIRLPNNNVTLNGDQSEDPDGVIEQYEWSQVFGPNTAVIATPNSSETNVSNLVRGTYIFKLKVTDDLSGVSENEVQIRVNGEFNEPPIVFAGNDTTISITSFSLDGTAFDWDGVICNSCHTWTYFSGPEGSTILNQDQYNTAVVGLVPGEYQFVLSATDDSSTTTTDTIKVIVVEPPVIHCRADAGVNQVIPKGTGMIVLDGSSSIGKTFKWTLLTTVPAKSHGYIKKWNEKIATAQIFPPITGGYNIELEVTDSASCLSKDTINISVNWPQLPPQAPNGNGWRRATVSDTVIANAAYGSGYMKINDVIVEANAGTSYAGGRLDVSILGASTLTVGPGTKIFIRAGEYRNIRLSFDPGKVIGSVDNPIIITNYGGQVKTQTLTILNVKNAILTGKYVPGVSGHPNYRGHDDGYAFSRGKYGIECNNEFTSLGSAGIRWAGTTNDSVEVSYIEICNGNFAGMMFKNDNTGEIWKNFYIHDLYVHDIHGEGAYYGSTSGTDPQNLMRNWKVYNNRFVNCGNDIFQFNNIGSGSEVYNNVFINSAENAKSTFSNSSQENGIQFAPREGGAKFYNNICIGAGYGVYNFFYGSKTGVSVGNDTVYLQNNIHLFSKGFLGGYLSVGQNPFAGMVVKIVGNYYGKFKFKGDSLFTSSSGKNVNSNVVLRTNGAIPKWYSRNNIIDGSDGKTVFMTGTGLDSSGNIIAPIEVPLFANSGWDTAFDWNNIERWVDSIYKRWGDEQTNTTGVYVGKPVVYNIGDYVTCFGKIYRSKVNNNIANMPKGFTDDYWELQTWSNGSETFFYPPEDYRLISGSTYALKGMGLLDVQNVEVQPSVMRFTIFGRLKNN